MSDGVRLSVCITTRNRAASIAETAENILAQFQFDDSCELVIVDGASTDNTVEVLNAIAKKNSRLRVVTPEKNSGLDADFDRAVIESRGDHCWLFSDDDLLVPGAIARVLALCAADPVAVIVDAAVYNSDFSQLLQPRRLPASGPTRYSDTESFFVDCAKHLTFIGAVVVRRSFWLSRARAPYFGSEFIHCGVLFQAPLPGEVIVLREPLIMIRYGVGNWRSRWFEVWQVKWPRLVWSFTWMKESTRRSVEAREPWTRASTLIQERAARRYGWQQFRKVLVPESDVPLKLVPPLLCAGVPWWGAYALVAAASRLNTLLGGNKATKEMYGS